LNKNKFKVFGGYALRRSRSAFEKIRNKNFNFCTHIGLLFNIKLNRFLKLVTVLMKDGKKASAYRIVQGFLILVKEKMHVISSVNFLDSIISMLEPTFYLKKTKRGGRVLFVPTPCRQNKRMFFGIKFFLEGVFFKKKQHSCSLEYAMFLESQDIFFKRQCVSMKKKIELMNQIFSYKSSSRFLSNY